MPPVWAKWLYMKIWTASVQSSKFINQFTQFTQNEHSHNNKFWRKKIWVQDEKQDE